MSDAPFPRIAAMKTPEAIWASSDEFLLQLAREIQCVVAEAPLELHVMYAPNPEAEASRRRTRAWLRDTGLIGSEAAYAWYCAWDIEDFVGGSYAQADSRGLDLCNKTISWVALFDDQLDGIEGHDVHHVRETVAPFLDILHGATTRTTISTPLLPTFQEIWEESKSGRSASWTARATTGWEYFLTASIFESANRTLEQKVGRSLDLFTELRGGSGAMEPFLNILEPGAGYELPPTLFNVPHMRRMRRCVANLVNNLNDIYSLHKEVARREKENLVLALQAEYGLSLGEAIRLSVEQVRDETDRLVELHHQIPEACAALELPEPDRTLVTRYADALELYISGFLAWQRSSPRYTEALDARPPVLPWAADELIARTTGSSRP